MELFEALVRSSSTMSALASAVARASTSVTQSATQEPRWPSLRLWNTASVGHLDSSKTGALKM